METRVTKLFLVLVLMTGLVVYTLESIRKFREHKISRNLYRDMSEKDNFMFPSVTICSAFRNGSSTPENIAAEAVKRAAEDPNRLSKTIFDSITYSRHDLSYFTQSVDDDWSSNLLDDDSMWNEEYHEYLGGRCATFNPTNSTKPGEINSIGIAIKLPTDRSWYLVS